MPNQVSKFPLNEFQRKIFLLKFTRELIRHSKEEIFELENALRKKAWESEKTKEEKPTSLIQKPILQKKPIPNEDLKEVVSETKKEMFKPLPKPFPMKRKIQVPVLRIPEIKLPQRFQYLKPIPTQKKINLEKLDFLLKDPSVRSIECFGPNQNVMVMGAMGRKKTNIILSREEIDEVIENFSKATKIPIYEGIFKVVLGRLIFTAIISKTVGSRFVIKKMIPNFRR